MSVTLFVEELSEDKANGYTTDPAMMLENAKKIFAKNVEYADDMIGLIFHAGRYVVIIARDIQKQLAMIFVDCKKDRETALSAASHLVGEARDVFMTAFEEGTKNYDKNYDLVELVVDRNFSHPISAN